MDSSLEEMETELYEEDIPELADEEFEEEVEEVLSLEEAQAELEEVMAVLEKLNGMKKAVAQNIVKARDKKLYQKVEEQRVLLQQLVGKAKLQEERKEELEAIILAAQIDLMTAECNEEMARLFDEQMEEVEEVANEEVVNLREKAAKRSRKSIRQHVAATVIGIFGVFGCLAGVIAYLLLLIVNGGEIEWLGLGIVGAVAAMFVIISLALNASANTNKAVAVECLEAADNIEAELAAAKAEAEAAEAEYMAYANSEIAAEAFALETEAANPVPEKKGFKLPNLKLGKVQIDTEKVKAAAKKNARVLVPTVAACTATLLATGMLTSSYKKRQNEKSKRALLNLLK